MDFTFHGIRQCQWIAGRHAHEQSDARIRKLRRRQINLREVQRLHVLFARGVVPRPRHDPDDGQRRRIWFQRLVVVELFADRVLVRKIFCGQSFVDDRYARLLESVLRREGAPAKDRHVERAKIIRRDHVHLGGWFPAVFVWSRASDVKRAVPFVVVEWNIHADPGGRDRRQRRNFRQQFIEERVYLFFLVVTRFGKRHRHRQDIVRIEPERSLLRAPETFQHQAAGGEEHDRERDLRYHQTGAGTLLVQTVTAPPRAFVQRQSQRGGLGNSPRRPHSDQHAGDNRDNNREAERRAVRGRRRGVRQRDRRRAEGGGEPPGHRDRRSPGRPCPRGPRVGH